jgi:hypothetical protein
LCRGVGDDQTREEPPQEADSMNAHEVFARKPCAAAPVRPIREIRPSPQPEMANLPLRSIGD